MMDIIQHSESSFSNFYDHESKTFCLDMSITHVKGELTIFFRLHGMTLEVSNTEYYFIIQRRRELNSSKTKELVLLHQYSSFVGVVHHLHILYQLLRRMPSQSNYIRHPASTASSTMGRRCVTFLITILISLVAIYPVQSSPALSPASPPASVASPAAPPPGPSP
ncbi:hypothetical protein Droror1_Dr00027146 [Drosera rotundifolia]